MRIYGILSSRVLKKVGVVLGMKCVRLGHNGNWPKETWRPPGIFKGAIGQRGLAYKHFCVRHTIRWLGTGSDCITSNLGSAARRSVRWRMINAEDKAFGIAFYD